MSLAVVHTRAKLGINAPLVSVEVHLSNGLPSMHMVGLPETAVKESKDRVRSAIINSHFDFPARRITVNLAPADLPKEGSRFDIAPIPTFDERFARQYRYEPPPELPLASPYAGIVHHLSGPSGHAHTQTFHHLAGIMVG